MVRYLADPSMATGGCLWFPDLTAADPLHILPLALSAILVLNVMPKSMPQLRILLGLDSTPEGAIGSSKWRLRLQRSLLMVAMAVGPLTMDLPAALHLYWISSAALTATQTIIISWLMPMPKNVPPAKRGESVFVMPTREKP
jgi:inner membrane protein COX18